MTRALLPGRWNRDGRAVPDARNCYLTDEERHIVREVESRRAEPPRYRRHAVMTDEEVAIREKAVVAFKQVEKDFSYPALIWWAIVSILAIGSFFAGLLVGSRS